MVAASAIQGYLQPHIALIKPIEHSNILVVILSYLIAIVPQPKLMIAIASWNNLKLNWRK